MTLALACLFTAFCTITVLGAPSSHLFVQSHDITLAGLEESQQPIFQVTSSARHDEIQPSYTLKSVPTTIYKPRSIDALFRARQRSLRHGQSERVEWDAVDMMGPDVQDKHTVSQIARLTGNAYALPGHKNWYDIDPTWNQVGLTLYSFISRSPLT